MFDPHFEPISKEKTIPHPLERTIKDNVSKHLKYVHNSIRNPKVPQIPQKNEKKADSQHEKLKFTIYGCRINKVFIHCVYMVHELSKYKPKNFDSPVITGVTNIEWPILLRDLQTCYGSEMHFLKHPVAVFLDDKFFGGLNELMEFMETKYNYYVTLNYYKLSIESFAKYVKASKRPCAYMHISVNEEYIGPLIFMLYADIAPLTCENFLRLCNTTRGGYSGTPIHRIVKEGWIQGGGFGLKSAPLDCENFIVPHDHRGVLAMANAERHVDCSTQFFVLLQPAPWMTYNYVAFGQLIDGEETLRKIEKVETFYESPKSNIRIDSAGILNLDCHYIPINKETNAYIQGHIEDLVDLRKSLWEEIMERVFNAIQQGEYKKFDFPEDDIGQDVHATKRFLGRASVQEKLGVAETENNEFDVDSYVYEADDVDDYNYSQVTPSLIVPDEEPYYIPLTDVLYSGDDDSTYDLKKYLKGDYCLETDLEDSSKHMRLKKASYDSEMILQDIESIESSLESLDSVDTQEVQNYLKFNTDKVSFSGKNIVNMAKRGEQINMKNASLFMFTDDGLRKIRQWTRVTKMTKKVSMSVDLPQKSPSGGIKRRPTGFIRTINQSLSDRSLQDTGSLRKVRIADSKSVKFKSVMTRLFEEAAGVRQTALKDYRSDIHDKYAVMTYTPTFQARSENNPSIEPSLWHDKVIRARDHTGADSKMPSVQNEYSKKRPTLSVKQYRQKNMSDKPASLVVDTQLHDLFVTPRERRLPDDTPLYSDVSIED